MGGKPKGMVWQYYAPDADKKSWRCKFCKVAKFIQNATRMCRHLESCKSCPPGVKAAFGSRSTVSESCDSVAVASANKQTIKTSAKSFPSFFDSISADQQVLSS